jgi:cysteine synthase A
VITEPHPDNGLLGARLDHVRELCDTDAHHIWLNQYSNENSWKAHYTTTGPEIAAEFPHLDVLFVGAGTTGTLMGCARYFKAHHPHVTIVAVDSVGSVTFGNQPARRMIPGLGSGIRPPMLDESLIDDVVLVEEADTVRTCHRLARTGFLFGGSTGTVVAGAEAWLAEHGTPGMTAATIAPDLGERYLDTIYQQHWVEDLYSNDTLTTDQLIAA